MPRDLVRWMRSFLLPVSETFHDAPWQPSVDVYRTRDGWLLKFDLAGVRAEDVGVRIYGNRLTVRGVRRDWCLEDGCRHYRLEIAYSHFERTLELPGNLDLAHVATEYRDGMLLVRIRVEGEP
jgi:HSP20 family protein